jgi:hypothetical protein
VTPPASAAASANATVNAALEESPDPIGTVDETFASKPRAGRPYLVVGVIADEVDAPGRTNDAHARSA